MFVDLSLMYRISFVCQQNEFVRLEYSAYQRMTFRQVVITIAETNFLW